MYSIPWIWQPEKKETDPEMEKITQNPMKYIFVCAQQRPPFHHKPSCGEAGMRIREALRIKVEEMGLNERVRVSMSGCLGPCDDGPNVMVFPDNVWYKKVSEADVDEIAKSELEPHMQDET